MSVEAYEVRKRSDKRGINRISDALPFGGLWYGGSNAISNAIDYAKFRSRSHDTLIRVYDAAGVGPFTQSNGKLICHQAIPSKSSG